MDQYSNAQKNRVTDFIGNQVRRQITPKVGFPADNIIGKDDQAKKHYILGVGSEIVAVGLLGLAFYMSLPLTGIPAIATGAVIAIHHEIAMKNYQLANVKNLFAGRDIQALKDMVNENKKLEAELAQYKDTKVGDLPKDLQKRSYKAIMKQYSTMKNLKMIMDKLDSVKAI